MENWNYTENINIARRYNNSKRSYLLVNRCQAKHIPVSPDEALGTSDKLGTQLREKYPNARFVIGFAETATAIGTELACVLGEDTIYVNTTREILDSSKERIVFSEEHSHAVEQQLCTENFSEYLNATDELVLVDDEISTGKTIFNIITALRKRYPAMSEHHVIIASILNRVSDKQEAIFNENNIFFECLYRIHTPLTDLTFPDEGLHPPDTSFFSVQPLSVPNIKRVHLISTKYPHKISGLSRTCSEAAEMICNELDLSNKHEVLVLGTEECMFPSIITARELSKRFGITTFCHSTTRSPAYFSVMTGYPMQNGCKIHSFYDKERINYIYNLRKYDAALIISDATEPSAEALSTMKKLLLSYGINEQHYYFGE